MKYNESNIDGVKFRFAGTDYLIDLAETKNVRFSYGGALATYAIEDICDKLNRDVWRVMPEVNVNNYSIF